MRTSRFVSRSFWQALRGVALLFAPVSDRRGSRMLGRWGRGVAMVAAIAGVGLFAAPIASATVSIPVGTNPFGVAVTPNGADVYVTNSGDGTVSEIQVSDDTVIHTITVGTSPKDDAVTPNGADVYVANNGAGTVSEIQTSDNTVINTITVGSQPWGVAVTPNGADVYVTNFVAGTVSEIQTSTNTVINTITVGSHPVGIAVTPDGADVYVVNDGVGTVSEIQTSDNTVINTINVTNNAPADVAVTPDGADAYVTMAGSNALKEIRTSDNTVINTIPVGLNPQGIAVTHDGAYVYISDFITNTTQKLSTASNTVVANFTVGNHPEEVAVGPDDDDIYTANFLADGVTALGLLPDATPAAASAAFGSAFSGQLAASPSSGAVTYTTTTTSPQVSVSSTGAITASPSTPLGTYTVSGTDSDSLSDVGTWTFTLTVVTQVVTTTSLSSSGTSSTVGGQVTYTVTIAPAPNGGTVSFADGQTPITGCGAQPITAGTATCTVTFTAAGSHVITAVYSGASSYQGSSDAVTQTVAPAPTTTTPMPTPTTTTTGATPTTTTTGTTTTGTTPTTGTATGPVDAVSVPPATISAGLTASALGGVALPLACPMTAVGGCDAAGTLTVTLAGAKVAHVAAIRSSVIARFSGIEIQAGESRLVAVKLSPQAISYLRAHDIARVRVTLTTHNSLSGGPVITSTQSLWLDVSALTGCHVASGAITDRGIGRLAPGMTRASAHRTGHYRVGRGKWENYCVAGGNLQAAYPHHPHAPARIVMILTANHHYAIRGIHAGASLKTARVKLHLGTGIRTGKTTWFFLRGAHITRVLQARHGRIVRVGVANRRRTLTRAQQRRTLRSLG